jgi:galactokinase
MDPTAVLCARPGCALLLDCATEELRHIPIKLPGMLFAVFDTGVRHRLAAGEYNKRRAECEQAARLLRATFVSRLTVPLLLRRGHLLTAGQARRVRHVLGENLRTAQFAAALRAGDVNTLGTLLNQSHRGLRDEYEVSCRELDVLQEILTAQKGVAGARMMGGGFGGSVLALATERDFPRVRAATARLYRKATGKRTTGLPLHPGGGAEVVTL